MYGLRVREVGHGLVIWLVANSRLFLGGTLGLKHETASPVDLLESDNYHTI